MKISRLESWRAALRDSAATARLAGVATAGAAALCGQLECGSAVAPINAISHLAWGESAACQEVVSVKYTLTGLLLNDSSMYSWAFLHELLCGAAARQGRAGVTLAGGTLVAGLAYLFDYHLVPAPLRPGLELRLSRRSLLVVYAVLALALGLGSLRPRREP